jgi:hypothetical protein
MSLLYSRVRLPADDGATGILNLVPRFRPNSRVTVMDKSPLFSILSRMVPSYQTHSPPRVVVWKHPKVALVTCHCDS